MTLLIASDALMAGTVRMLRSESAVGPFVLGLTEKREKVPHPGLQHDKGKGASGAPTPISQMRAHKLGVRSNLRV